MLGFQILKIPNTYPILGTDWGFWNSMKLLHAELVNAAVAVVFVRTEDR